MMFIGNITDIIMIRHVYHNQLDNHDQHCDEFAFFVNQSKSFNFIFDISQIDIPTQPKLIYPTASKLNENKSKLSSKYSYLYIYTYTYFVYTHI